MKPYITFPCIFRGIAAASALMAGLTAHAQQYIITTVAGNGNPGYTGDGGAATAARTSTPATVATDTFGNVYFTDYDHSVIRKVSNTGIITTVAGTGTAGYSGDSSLATAAKLNAPLGITADKVGNLYIADNMNHVVRKVSTTGIITTIAGTGGVNGYSGDNGPATAAKLDGPSDVAVDDSGNLFIADRYNYVIRKVDTGGTITTVAGRADSTGYAGNGGPAKLAILGDIFGIATDHAGNLYLAESYPQHTVRKINGSGIISLVAGNDASANTGDGQPATDTRITGPADVAADDSGNIYFTEIYSEVVRKVDAAGIISTFAGQRNASGYSGDGGRANEAKLNGPIGLATDRAGAVYVADAYNSRVRKIAKEVVGIIPTKVSTFRLYPNPTSGILYINASEDVVVQIKDLTGALLLNTTLNCNGATPLTLPARISNGAYVITIRGSHAAESLLFTLAR